MFKRQALLVVLVFLLTTLFIGWGAEPSGIAQGQESKPKWPTRDIKIIVPYKPGGGFDIKARLVAPLIVKYLPHKVNVVILNVSGAGGSIGLREGAMSNPDGYTLVLTDPLVVGTFHKMGKLGSLDPKTITFLGQLEQMGCVVTLGKTGRFKKFDDMRGQVIRFSSVGDNELPSGALAEAMGAKALLVAYDGLPESIMAVARGDIDVAVASANTAVRQIKALEGKLVPIAMIGGHNPRLPGVKTVTELGINIDEEVGVHRICIGGPPNMPIEVQKILREVIHKATHDPEFASGMDKAGYDAVPLGGSELQVVVDKIFKLVDKYERY
jgi:tripartite-type tricarboxylate transporter receptor subunit TctC